MSPDTTRQAESSAFSIEFSIFGIKFWYWIYTLSGIWAQIHKIGKHPIKKNAKSIQQTYIKKNCWQTCVLVVA